MKDHRGMPFPRGSCASFPARVPIEGQILEASEDVLPYRCCFVSICRLCERFLIVRNSRNWRSLRNGVVLPSVRRRSVEGGLYRDRGL